MEPPYPNWVPVGTTGHHGLQLGTTGHSWVPASTAG